MNILRVPLLYPMSSSAMAQDGLTFHLKNLLVELGYAQ